MSKKDRVRWDSIYKKRAAGVYPAPDPLLLQFTPVPHAVEADEAAPRALDLAAGLGQNGLWLAEQGYSTDIMDISRVALNLARTEMSIRNLRNINLLPMDVDSLALTPNTYDVICVFRYLKRDIFQIMRDAIRPEGRIIYETFNLNYLNQVADFNRAFLLQPDELLTFFPGWRVVHHEEHQHITQLVAVKPA